MNKNIKNNTLLQETLKENEIKANRLCCGIFTLLAVVFFLAGVLNILHVFNMKNTVLPFLALGIAMLLVPVVFNRIGRLSPDTMKVMILVCICTIALLTDAINSYNAALIIALPIMMAAMYFEVSTVVVTSVATVVSFWIEMYISALHGIHIDNNHVNLSEGTVLVIKDGLKNTLAGALEPGRYVMDTMTKGYVPKLLLLGAFIAIAIAIADYGRTMLLRQATVTAEQTRISTELELANKLQADALPDASDISGKYGFDIAASMTAARETGGDFYDFTMLDDDHLAIVIADVSDKGVPAAMFMMSAKSTIHDVLSSGRSSCSIIEEANNRLCARNKEGMFVTVWLGIYEISSGILTSTNAGHENPIRINADGSCEEVNEDHGPLMGIFEDMKYEENVTKLNSGDVLFLYTDGVTEANNQEGKMYGMERLVEGLGRNLSGENITAAEIMDTARKDIAEFAGDAEQFDDITMVVLKI